MYLVLADVASRVDFLFQMHKCVSFTEIVCYTPNLICSVIHIKKLYLFDDKQNTVYKSSVVLVFAPTIFFGADYRLRFLQLHMLFCLAQTIIICLM